MKDPFAIGDGGQTAISLMPGVAGTGSGFLLDSILLKKILYYYTLCSVCVCVCVHVHACELVTQSCQTLCDPMDCSPPGSSVH